MLRFSVPLFFFASHCIIFQSFSQSAFSSVSHSLPVCLPVCLSRSICFSVSLSISVCFPPSVCLSVWLSLFIFSLSFLDIGSAFSDLHQRHSPTIIFSYINFSLSLRILILPLPLLSVYLSVCLPPPPPLSLYLSLRWKDFRPISKIPLKI